MSSPYDLGVPGPLDPVEERRLRQLGAKYLLFLWFPIVAAVSTWFANYEIDHPAITSVLNLVGVASALVVGFSHLLTYGKTRQARFSWKIFLLVVLSAILLPRVIFRLASGAQRMQFMGALEVATALAVFVVGNWMLTLYADSVLSAIDRRPSAYARAKPPALLALLVAAVACGIVLWGGVYHKRPQAALVALAGFLFCAFVLSLLVSGRPGRQLRYVASCFRFFLAYDGRTPRVDGVTKTDAPLEQRQLGFLLLFLLVYLTTNLGLSFCVPGRGALAWVLSLPLSLALPFLWMLTMVSLPIAISTRRALTPVPFFSDPTAGSTPAPPLDSTFNDPRQWVKAVAALRAESIDGRDGGRDSFSSTEGPIGVFLVRWIRTQLAALFSNKPHSIASASPGALTISSKRRPDIYLGRFKDSHHAAILDRAILDEGHVYLAGMSKSGKTSRGIIPLLQQLAYVEPGCAPDPIIIIDAKGDSALINTARRLATATHPDGTRIRDQDDLLFFSTDSRLESAYFNPFLNFNAARSTTRELAETLIQALGLYHGDFYGASYFSDIHRYVMSWALEESKSGRPESLRDLLGILRNTKARNLKSQDIGHLIAVLYNLSLVNEVNRAPAGQREIFMPDVYSKGLIAYFDLPGLVDSMTVSTVGKLALYAALATADEFRVRQGRPVKHYIIIDEFQAVASDNLKRILEMARSYGASLILSSQDPVRLNDKPEQRGLLEAVLGECAFQQYFSAPSPEIGERLINQSGKKPVLVRSWTIGEGSVDGTSGDGELHTSPASRNIRYQESERPNLEENDLKQVGEGTSLVHFLFNSGRTQTGRIPKLVESPWSMSKNEYEELVWTPLRLKQEPSSISPPREKPFPKKRPDGVLALPSVPKTETQLILQEAFLEFVEEKERARFVD